MPTVCWAIVLDVKLLIAYKRGKHDNKYDMGEMETKQWKGTRKDLQEKMKFEKSCENH